MALSADQAAKLAPVFSAGVILAGAFAVIAFLAPGARPEPRDIQPSGLQNTASGGAFEEGWPESHWTSLSESLAALNHLYVEEAGGERAGEPGVPGATAEGGGVPAASADGGPREIDLGGFKYLGSVVLGGEPAGLIMVNDRQRFVGAGDQVGEYEIVSIERESLILKIKGVERRLKRAPRGESALPTDQRYNRQRDRAAELQRRANEGRQRNQSPPNPDRPNQP